MVPLHTDNRIRQVGTVKNTVLIAGLGIIALMIYLYTKQNTPVQPPVISDGGNVLSDTLSGISDFLYGGIF